MINGYVKCEISDFFILDTVCKGTREHGVKLVKISSNRDEMI